MNIDNIRFRLKDIIRSRGFTQEEFAEACEMPLPTLRKYLDGKTYFSIDILDRFSKVLDVSYDYLLCKSDSLQVEYANIQRDTHLSENAIKKIVTYASLYESNPLTKALIDTLDAFICEDTLWEKLTNYLTYTVWKKSKSEMFINSMPVSDHKDILSGEILYLDDSSDCNIIIDTGNPEKPIGIPFPEVKTLLLNDVINQIVSIGETQSKKED